MKKVNGYTIAIIVLSVLLTISLIVGSTFAWFYSTDSANVTLQFGDPVVLRIVDEANQDIDLDDGTLPISFPGAYLVPGMNIDIYAAAMFDVSNTPALLRAKFDVDITGGTATEGEIAALVSVLNASLDGVVQGSGANKWVFIQSGTLGEVGEENEGDWWYYLGPNAKQIGDLGESVVEKIDNSSASNTIEFINSALQFPIDVNNLFAGAQISFNVTFQSLQGVLPAFTDPTKVAENDGATGYRLNKVKNIYSVFESAFEE